MSDIKELPAFQLGVLAALNAVTLSKEEYKLTVAMFTPDVEYVPATIVLSDSHNQARIISAGDAHREYRLRAQRQLAAAYNFPYPGKI